MNKRRRGTAIVETDRGILLTAMNKNRYRLPGGEAKQGESRFSATIRELKEETDLIAHYARVLFEHEGLNNSHTVVLIKANGNPKPKNEVRYIDFYKRGKKIQITKDTKEIIAKYYKWKSRINFKFEETFEVKSTV
ncbi:NUDIX domain-containing protein [Natroniella sulfidigena]|uniref:NUDIX domain-containing protein n=1 Tax=Natroniella sulfidigena TaxID=723921 RepID=UPI002009FFDF|nr:NUDIX domain-containing protein [Natroniella sulfidigena]